ncbi:hypothetical protein ACGC1H_003853 [Rhizoctonia solani]
MERPGLIQSCTSLDFGNPCSTAPNLPPARLSASRHHHSSASLHHRNRCGERWGR